MFPIPTVKDLKETFISTYEAESGSTVPRVQVSWISIVATVYAACTALLYRAIKWASEQQVPQTADEGTLGYMAEVRGITRKAAATTTLQLAAKGTAGTVIPAGMLWNIGGKVYEQTEAVELVSTEEAALFAASAAKPGAQYNQTPGTQAEPSSPIAGLSETEVKSVLVQGFDEETLPEFRQRVTESFRKTPQGGSAADYVNWALECDGIIRAFAKRAGQNSVTVYPLVALSGKNRVPPKDKLDEVSAYVDDTSRRPLCVTANAAPCEELKCDVAFTGTTQVAENTRLAVEDALKTYFYAAYPRQFSDEFNATDVISVGGIWTILKDLGVHPKSVALCVGGTECTARTLQIGEIAAPGRVTWG